MKTDALVGVVYDLRPQQYCFLQPSPPRALLPPNAPTSFRLERVSGVVSCVLDMFSLWFGVDLGYGDALWPPNAPTSFRLNGPAVLLPPAFSAPRTFAAKRVEKLQIKWPAPRLSASRASSGFVRNSPRTVPPPWARFCALHRHGSRPCMAKSLPQVRAPAGAIL